MCGYHKNILKLVKCLLNKQDVSQLAITFDQPMTVGDLYHDHVLINVWLRCDKPHGQNDNYYLLS